jgi:hypothetical protein
MGCKRVLMSNEYYQALTKPHVDLVTDPIERIDTDGIVTRDGARHTADVIIYATGFMVGDAGAPFTVRGEHGVDLDAEWRNAQRAYLGATVPSFPNLFMLCGPNTGLSHTSIIFMLESLTSYIVDAVLTMRDRKLDRVAVRRDACDRYNDEIQARFPGTVWSSGCKSWYQAKDGTNVAIWPGSTVEFRRRTRRFDLESYDVLEASKAAQVAAPRVPAPPGAPRVRRPERRMPPQPQPGT